MISEATAVSFRQNLGDMLNQMQVRHDSIVIKRDGKPVAASGLGHLQAQELAVPLLSADRKIRDYPHGQSLW